MSYKETTKPVFTVSCDDCGKEVQFDRNSKSEIRSLAETRAWIFESNLCYCQKCINNDEKQAIEKVK